MKTLLERVEALVASTQDWFLGKEMELHREHAAIARDLALEVQALRAQVQRLEDSIVLLSARPPGQRPLYEDGAIVGYINT